MALSPDFTARESRNYHLPVEGGLIIKTKIDDDLTIPKQKRRKNDQVNVPVVQIGG